MSSRPARFAVLLVSALATTLGTVPGHADPQDGGDRLVAPAFRPVQADEDTLVTQIKVSWAGAGYRDYTETAKVPGIGTLKLVCNPDNTIVKLTADSRVPETQMWLAKYETKNDRNVVAVKNARIYKYANANDDGKGGTGWSAHEGLNQKGHVENYAKGYAFGLISQRPGRHQPAGDAPLSAVSSFYLTWWWNGFEHPREYQACEFKLRMVTHLDERVGINWHGDQDAAGHTVRSATVPGLGEIRLVCEPGRVNEQTITLDPELEGGSVYSETITGEGAIEDHVETGALDYDPESGLIGPLELPRNGMIRLRYTVPDGQGGEIARWFYLSSYTVVNNANHPELNVCEVAVGGAADQD